MLEIPPGGMWAKVNCFTQTGREQATTLLKQHKTHATKAADFIPTWRCSCTLQHHNLVHLYSTERCNAKWGCLDGIRKKRSILKNLVIARWHLRRGTNEACFQFRLFALWSCSNLGDAPQRGKNWSVSSRPRVSTAHCELSRTLMSPLRKSIHPIVFTGFIRHDNPAPEVVSFVCLHWRGVLVVWIQVQNVYIDLTITFFF